MRKAKAGGEGDLRQPSDLSCPTDPVGAARHSVAPDQISLLAREDHMTGGIYRRRDIVSTEYSADMQAFENNGAIGLPDIGALAILRPMADGLRTLGGRLREARKRQNMTQTELAATASASQSQISEWEKNERVPELENLISLADALRVSVDHLLGRDLPRHSTHVVVPGVGGSPDAAVAVGVLAEHRRWSGALVRAFRKEVTASLTRLERAIASGEVQNAQGERPRTGSVRGKRAR